MRSKYAGETTSSAELVAGIARLAAELAGRPAPESGAACYEQVEVLGQAVDLIESAIAARVTVAARSGQVAEWGHTSPTAWLRTSLAMRHARAEERATLAAQLPRLPQVAKRLAAGDLSVGYATAIASGVRRLDAADCGKAEDLLLGFVDEGHSVAQITRFADKIKDLIAERDDTCAEPEDGRRAERQWLALHRSGAGAFVKGRFGAELMALIKAKLGPLARPCGPDDVRDHAERLADALQIHLSKGDSRWDPILVVDLKQPGWLSQSAPEQPTASSASRRQVANEPVPTAEPSPPPSSTAAGTTLGERQATTMTKPTPASERLRMGRSPASPSNGTSQRPAADPPHRRQQAPAEGPGATAADESSRRHRPPRTHGAEDDPGTPAAPRTHEAKGDPDTPWPPRTHGTADDPGTPAAPRTHGTEDDSGTPAAPRTHEAESDPGTPAAPRTHEAESDPGTPAAPRTHEAESDPGTPRAPRALSHTWPFDGTPFTARLADGTAIPMERARTILLNAGFSTLVLGTDGQPLYLGRRVRCASPAQRRALLARYPTCVVDGCEIPADGCQIDHVDGWENGQPTDIDRLVMCCSWHNRYKWRHPDRVTIIQRADGRYLYQIARPTAHQHGQRSRRTVHSSDRGP